MADNDEEKTEQPSQKKLDDAREKGQVVTSRELNHWFMILGCTIFVMMLIPSGMSELASALVVFIEQPHAIKVDAASLGAILGEVLQSTALVLAVPLGLLLVMAVGSSVAQHGWLTSMESIKPKFEKVSPGAGFKRLFSMKALVEFGKGILKVAIVGAVGTILLLPAFSDIETMAGLDAAAMLGLMQSLTVRLLIGVLAVMGLIAGLDFLFQRFQHIKQLRMSRQEMKEEYKQSEGDPMVKQRIRQIRMERSRRRMIAAVPEADVVITNPTHFAVALKYDQATMSAPRCVAKGADTLALRIREVAREHKVAVIENPPLARALHASVDIDEEVPVEHYKAVAEIISYVWKLKRR